MAAPLSARPGLYRRAGLKRGMRFALAAVLGLALALLATGSAAALPANAVTFIPDTVSARSSFLMVVDPGAANARVNWLIPTVDGAEYGQVPKEGGRWFCYFSNTDAKSSCGPSPFNFSTYDAQNQQFFDQFQVQVNTTALGGSGAEVRDGALLSRHVGSIKPTLQVTNSTNADGSMTLLLEVYAPASDPVNTVVVDAYYANLTKLGAQSGVQLEKTPGEAYWSGKSITLAPGDYFLAVTARGDLDFGGSITQVTVPGSAAATACTPATGSGPVRIDDGGTIEVVTGKERVAVTTKTKVTNRGTAPWTDISFIVPTALTGYLKPSLTNGTQATTSVKVNESAFLVVELAGIDRGMEVNTSFTIVARNGTATVEPKAVGEVPFAAKVSYLNDQQGCPGVVGVSATPTSISASAAVGEAVELKFKLVNGATATANILGKTSAGLGAVEFETADGVLPGNTASVIATVTPAQTGTLTGSITIATDQGDVTVPVTLTVRASPASGIGTVKANLESYRNALTAAESSALATALADVEAGLTAAETKAADGDIEGAERALLAAEAKLEALRSVQLPSTAPSPSPSPPSATTALNPLVIVLLIALVGLVVAFIIVRKRKKGAVKEEAFEQEAEEALKEPEEESEEEF